VNEQKISKGFDIFSLGVIIIKIICGPAAHSPGDDKTRKFIRQVKNCHMFPSISMVNLKMFVKCVDSIIVTLLFQL
jgi:hypothetical protein